MRIDLNQASQPLPETNGNKANSATGSTAGGALTGEDQADLSGAHAQVQSLVAQAAQLPEVRQERVSALRQTVQSGLYHPGPEQMAGAIFDHMIVVPSA